MNWKNAEGFVVRFSNGQRCKIKFEDYIRLHRIMTGFSEKRVWEALEDGKPLSEFLENVPDELFDEIHRIEKNVKEQYENFNDTYTWIFEKKMPKNCSRKSFAEAAKAWEHPNILFAMLDGKDYSQIIWKIIEPKFKNI